MVMQQKVTQHRYEMLVFSLTHTHTRVSRAGCTFQLSCIAASRLLRDVRNW